MTAELSKYFPKTPAQELRFEIFARAAQGYERARIVRAGSMLAVAAAALFLSAYSLFGGPDPKADLTPLMCGISGFASLVTLANAWLSSAERDRCWHNYCDYLSRTGGGTDLQVPPV